MKNKKPLNQYISRLLQQTGVVITGLFGFLITALADIFLPNINVSYIYIVIFIGAIIIGGYNIFKDTLDEVKALETRIQELENKKPNIIVGFLDKNKRLSKNMRIDLQKLPNKPDFDNLVNQKKNELLEKSPSHSKPNNFTHLPLSSLDISSIFVPNENYQEEVEIYLKNYKNYLIEKYEADLDRAFRINISVENNGNYPANSVTIQLYMPEEYSPPLEHQCFDRKTISKHQINYYVRMPLEPEAYTNVFNHYEANILMRPNYDEPVIFPTQSNINGPSFEEKNGEHEIIYTIEKLIQHKPEKDFDPFWIWLGNVEINTIWPISVKITSAELSEPIIDTLYIEIQVS